MTYLNSPEKPSGLRSFFASRWGLLVLCGITVIGLYLFVTHTGHLLGALPYLLLLACPLLHVFMHGRHHGRDH